MSWPAAGVAAQRRRRRQRRGDSLLAGPAAMRFGQSAASAVGVTLLGFVLTLYLLIEGHRRTTGWWPSCRGRAAAKSSRRSSSANASSSRTSPATSSLSVIAFTCTLIALSLLKVPAALLLAVIAGVSDFLPVIGFLVGAVPTILLALTVSTTTAVIVAAFYIGYNTVETYLLGPWAYGDRLKLSNVAVILAFVIGAGDRRRHRRADRPAGRRDLSGDRTHLAARPARRRNRPRAQGDRAGRRRVGQVGGFVGVVFPSCVQLAATKAYVIFVGACTFSRHASPRVPAPDGAGNPRSFLKPTWVTHRTVEARLASAK